MDKKKGKGQGVHYEHQHYGLACTGKLSEIKISGRCQGGN